MKATGIVRRIDGLGRIVIPRELRTVRGIAEGDPVEIFVDSDVICLKPVKEVCAICGRTSELFKLHPVKEAKVCESCIQAVNDIVVEG